MKTATLSTGDLNCHTLVVAMLLPLHPPGIGSSAVSAVRVGTEIGRAHV